MQKVCPQCHETLWSAMDKSYLALFKVCWQCDEKNYQSKEITLKEFNSREDQALNQAIR